jgi:hypothetical protein
MISLFKNHKERSDFVTIADGLKASFTPNATMANVFFRRGKAEDGKVKQDQLKKYVRDIQSVLDHGGF